MKHARLIVILLFKSALVAQAGQAGSEQFLDIFPQDGRSLGMGYAGAASFPAAKGRGFVFSTLHAGLPFGDEYFFASAGANRGPLGAGISFSQVSCRDIERTGVDSITSSDTIAYHTLSTTDARENLFSGALALRVSPGVRLGLKAKYYGISLAGCRGAGFGADAGVFCDPSPDGFGAGLTVVNAVPARIVYRGLGSEALRPSARLAVSRGFMQGKISFCLEARQVLASGGGPALYAGGEYRPLEVIAFRAGLAEWDKESRGILCLGAGLCAKGFSVDYAFNSYPGLAWDTGHRIGLSYRNGN